MYQEKSTSDQRFLLCLNLAVNFSQNGEREKGRFEQAKSQKFRQPGMHSDGVESGPGNAQGGNIPWR